MEYSYKDVLNKKISLVNGAIYKSDSPKDRNYQNYKDHVLTKLFPVQNQGGFRFKGSTNPFNLKLVVLYANGGNLNWEDKYSKETNQFIYYGDNDGKYENFLETRSKGNKVLKETFKLAESKNLNERKKIPPFFITKKNGNKDIILIGLGVPALKNGVAELEEIEMINNGKTFKNYKATFDVLKIEKIDVRWIDDILIDKTFESNYLPIEFSNYINMKKETKNIEKNIIGKDKEVTTKSRVGHEEFKKILLEKEACCKICKMSNKNLLIASHIKPWSQSNEIEKVDVDNGFLLCPHHDSLFDKGYISFKDNGEIIISSQLSEDDKIKMNVNYYTKIDLSIGNKEYLKYHRERIFLN